MNPLMMAMGGQNVASVMQMLRFGNPEQIAQNMLSNNPQFRQFMEQNKGKTPEQVAREHGIDLPSMMKRI